MKLYKIYSRAIGLLFALSLLCVGCENEDILDINDLEISPSNPESVVIVEPDDGITSVNALTKAINENGDATYILRRDGVYYMEGKNVFKHNVVIKAENGSGKMPIIQPICDAQGALNADMIRLEGSATFENIYIISCFANLLYQCFHTILESRIKIASYHRIRCTRFLCIGYVGWETNAVKSVRITDCRCSHPVNIHSWNDFDILFFYAFPSMITIGYYFFDTVCLYVFYAIPRNVFFVYRSVWKRIIGWNTKKSVTSLMKEDLWKLKPLCYFCDQLVL